MKFVSKILIVFLVFSLLGAPCYAKKKQTKEGTGYMGTLPDISRYFRYKQKDAVSNPENVNIIENLDANRLKKAPDKDAVFLDVIIKKKKPSKYIDDLLAILPVVEKLRMNISEGGDIQKFNSGVNTLDLYVSKLQRSYNNKPESVSKSYAMLQDVNYRAKVLGNLKYESNFYSKYKPVLEEEYTPQYLQKHDEILLHELDKTIFILKSECDDAQYGKQ